MFDKARTARNDASAGRDAWRPAELALLPRQAWAHRKRVVDLVIEEGRWPKAYHEVVSPCLRKMDKLDPKAGSEAPTVLDHSLLSIYTQLYRIEVGVWCANHQKWFDYVTHKDSCGGVKNREPCEAVWDAQAMLESALNGKEEKVVALLDY